MTPVKLGKVLFLYLTYTNNKNTKWQLIRKEIKTK